MSLSARLARLEVRRAARGSAGPSPRERLLSRLDNLAQRVRAWGDLDDDPRLSPAERLVRAFERGDDTTARAVLARAVGQPLPPAWGPE